MSLLWIYDPLVLFRVNQSNQLVLIPKQTQTLVEKINSMTRVILLFTIFGYSFTKSIPILLTGIVFTLFLIGVYFYQTSRVKEGMTPNMKIGEVMNDNPDKNVSTLHKVQDSSLDNAQRKPWYPQKTQATKEQPTDERGLPIHERADQRPQQRITTEQAPTVSNPMMNVMMTDYRDDPKRPRAEPAFAPSVRKEINEKTKKGIEETLEEKLFRDLGDEIDFEQSMQRFYTTPNTQIPNNQSAFAEFCYGNMSSCKDGDVDKCFENEKKYGQNYA